MSMKLDVKTGLMVPEQYSHSQTPVIKFGWKVSYQLERADYPLPRDEMYDTKEEAMRIANNIVAEADCVYVAVTRVHL